MAWGLNVDLRNAFDVFYANFVQVLNVALSKSRVSLLSSQRMLDRVVYLLLSKDQARLKYNVWIMVMVPAPFRMYLKNQVCPLSEPVVSVDKVRFHYQMQLLVIVMRLIFFS